MPDDLFGQVATVLLLAAGLGALATVLRQPLIVAFIAVGIVAGPSVLGVVEPGDQLALLAEIGIALLLFVVGLKLDLRHLRTVGPVALAAGLGQVAFTSGFGFAIALGLGLAPVTALYVAVALTFSSTIIIVKLLTDKREIDHLYGRIAVGFLIVQDIVVVVAMIVLTGIGETGEDAPWLQFLRVAGSGVAFVVALAAAARWLLTPLLHRIARSRELLVLAAIAWAVGLAAAGDALGLSMEVGAFLGGVALASTPYREALGARLVSVRDFLLLFFFIELGARVELDLLGAQLGDALVLSLFVLVGNPLIVMVILGAMGYRRRVSFFAGLTVAQISEFSLILTALGLSLGHIGEETLGLVTTVGLVTIGLSTYFILYADRLYRPLAPYLGLFERRSRLRPDELDDDAFAPEVVVFGLGRFGSAVATGLHERGVAVLGIDLDPRALGAAQSRGLAVLWGDAEDLELPSVLPLHATRWLVSTIRRLDDNIALAHALRHLGYGGRIAAAAEGEDEAAILRRAGVDAVLLPFVDAARQTVDFLGGELGPRERGDRGDGR